MRISIQSLGCPKNFVDSEIICGYLLANNHTLTNDMKNSDVAIINTCSFIQPAVKESIDAILEAAQLKKTGKIQSIIVAGCLSQRYSQQELEHSLPEVDAFIGVDELDQINHVVGQLRENKLLFRVNSNPFLIYDEKSPRLIMTPGHYAYLKISEGCNNGCTYCLIPRIKGKYRSRTMESILAEARNLAEEYPLKELILIAEDTTYYGMDLYGKPSLGELLKRLVRLPWNNEIRIRILYTHPAHYEEQLINVMARNPMICPYLDIPLQHISDNVLQRMNRGISQKEILALIKRVRDQIPRLTLRTTFIVGFPGETQTDFQELYDFVREYRFDKVGVFPYYNEPECPAFRMSGHVSGKIKKFRLDSLMKLQQKIALEKQKAKVGQTIRVLIDECSESGGNLFSGRSCAEAPEIDGNISVRKAVQQDIGKWLDVKLTKATPYQLQGEKVTLN